jgi:hypothetical protein
MSYVVFLKVFFKNQEPEDDLIIVKTCCYIRQILCVIEIVVLKHVDFTHSF